MKIIKRIILLFIVIANFNTNCYSQTDTLTPKIIKLFENFCPYYLVENYCSFDGQKTIIEKAQVDDRVAGVKIVNPEFPGTESAIAVKYNNSVLVFNKYKDTDYLTEFRVELNNEEDLNLFLQCYRYLFGFIKDSENGSRFYSEKFPMNAIVGHSDNTKKRFFASCFVLQPGFCDN